MRHLWVLMLVALPASADEITFALSGEAVDPNDLSKPTEPFTVDFTIDTAGSSSSFGFNTSSGCLESYTFTAAAYNLTGTISGRTVLSSPATRSLGSAGPFGSCGLINYMGVGGFAWTEFETAAPTSLSATDPLADLLSRPFPCCSVGFMDGYELDIEHTSTRVISAPEPGTLVLFGLGLAGLAVRRRRDLAAHKPS
jgi:hypothetical protein